MLTGVLTPLPAFLLPPSLIPDDIGARVQRQERDQRELRMHALFILGATGAAVGGILLSTLGYQREAAALSIAGVIVGGGVAAVRLLARAD